MDGFDYAARIERAQRALAAADKVIIGGGAGLSSAAGLEYGGSRFEKLFSPWIERYGIPDMYAGGFYPYATEEERWGYWARHILANRFEEPPLPLYAELLRLVEEKDFFVITTNVESQFEKTGFPARGIFEVQGNYGLIQCAKGCHDTLYHDEELVRMMAARTDGDLCIPSELVPACPVCGGPMEVHVRKDAFFVEDDTWHEASERYAAFVRSCAGTRTVLLELGVGFNTPGIIRYPFENIAYRNPENVTLIRLNRNHPSGADENRDRTVAFTEDMTRVIGDLREGAERP
ncbi:SIR2 family NAD-dependent protein deacylase [Raoultibacter phocaeensis]|uniref:SIR2 family NAD-dependent protein deacylase n=1 Tax=Raoultibacter phocaeensis TaxID=2479841 RepID=UPI00111990F0|nr:Sir2 silent information regulator family NAD-dependent deacetylase [Raoultibacter phocaeensis]